MKEPCNTDEPLEIERKFLIDMPDTAILSAQADARADHIVQTYLLSPDGITTRRVRRRTHADGTHELTETSKQRISDLVCIERERRIGEEEYKQLLTERDSTRQTISKTRYVIRYGNHKLEIDIYPFWQRVAVLEVELTEPDEPIALPPYLHVIREVSDDTRFKNRSLARHIPDETTFFVQH